MYLFVILPSAAILLLAYYIRSLQPSYKNLPPGPFVLPILGSLPEIVLRKPTLKLKVKPWEYIDHLSKVYGDLFYVKILHFNVVCMTSHELFTEVANMEEYSIKFAHEMITYPRTFGKELGLIFVANTPMWSEMRKFTQRTLREFGFGKEYTMHSVIIDEVNTVMEQFRKTMQKTNGIVRFRNTFSVNVLNVLWCMVAGVRYKPDDPKFQKLIGHIFELSKSAAFGNPLEIILPYMKSWAPMFFNVESRYKTYDESHIFSKEILEERRAAGFYLSNPQNYIDVFLKKIHENKNNPDTVYTDQQLQSMIVDLLMAGSLTLNAALNYQILYLALNPDLQEKIQNEIDSVVPRCNIPTVEDIEKMPWFQACMLESFRLANVVPHPIPRLAPKDWILRGYRIPKDTIIFSNHYSINLDDKIWGDAKVYRPGRFISKEGEFMPHPKVTIFGFGKRNCMGIQLVGSIVPLFLAMLLKNFSFSVVPGTKPPSTEPEIGVSLSPKEFPVLLTQRESATSSM